MTLPAQRMGDVNTSGGIIVAGIPTVLVEGLPIAVAGMPVTSGGLTTPTQFGVFSMGIPVIRMGDPDTSGSLRVGGAMTVLVGQNIPSASITQK